MRRLRTAILISGRGSNMDALIDAARAPDFPAEIALVLSNRPDAPGLARAKGLGLATAAVDHKIYAGREEFERSMQILLDTLSHRLHLPRRFHAIVDALVHRRLERQNAEHPPCPAPFFPRPSHA